MGWGCVLHCSIPAAGVLCRGGRSPSGIPTSTVLLDCIVDPVSCHWLSVCQTPTHTLVLLKQPSPSLWDSPAVLYLRLCWPLLCTTVLQIPGFSPLLGEQTGCSWCSGPGHGEEFASRYAGTEEGCWPEASWICSSLLAS